MLSAMQRHTSGEGLHNLSLHSGTLRSRSPDGVDAEDSSRVLHLVPRLTCRRTQSRCDEDQAARGPLCIRRRLADELTAVEQLQRITAFVPPNLKMVAVAVS
jgi:hypothetical protein